MKKIVFVIFLVFFTNICLNLSISSITTDKKSRVWVFFKDKGDKHKDKIGYPIPSKTLIRRHRAGFRYTDISDLPVYSKYVDGILQFNAKLCNTSRWLNGITVEVPEKTIAKISSLPYVKSVEPVISYKLNIPGPKYRLSPRAKKTSVDEFYGVSEDQIKQIKVNTLHDKGYHGEGIIIALLDSGFDLSHKALQNVRVIAEYDFVNNDQNTSDNPPEDDIGQDNHGTEILSIIAGYSPGEFVGVAYKSEYLLAKTEKVSYQGVDFEYAIEEDWWIAGLEWAEINGADIVSSSLGYSDWYSYSDIDGKTAKTTIAANMAVDRGVVVVVSAGNESKSRNWPYISAPADGFHVMAIGAVDASGRLASFSSMGPTYDGRIKPDLVAMGDETYVVDPNDNKGYVPADGTSMSAPLVAGACALLMQALPDINKPKDLEKLLKYTASNSTNPNNRYGWGIVNADAAFKAGINPKSMEAIKKWELNSTFLNFPKITVYPNPIKLNSAKNVLSIYSPQYFDSISIYDISGNLVYEKKDMGMARFFNWDLINGYGNPIAPGIYLCVIKGIDKDRIIKKIAVTY